MSSTRIAAAADVKDAYRRVMDRVAQAATRVGRHPDSIHIVAVTKTASPDQIRALVEMGHVDFGENRAQHLSQRVAQLEEFLSRRRTLRRVTATNPDQPSIPSEVRWHMFGHLQRNKVKQVVPLVKLIHSVDSLRLAEEVHGVATRMDRVVDVLLQVNTSGEAGKSGVLAPAAIHLAEQIDTMMHLRLRGLMAMAPMPNDPEETRPAFSRMAEIFEEIDKEGISDGHFNVLSMGMTNDFEVAIEYGANVLRIGRGLFGEG